MKQLVLRSSEILDERSIAVAAEMILRAAADRPIVFVEAMGQTVQTLVEAGEKSADQDLVLASALAEGLRTFHAQLAQQITSPSVFRETRSLLWALYEELSDFLKGLYLLGQFDDHARRMVSSYGERSSCILIAHVLRSRDLSAIPFGERELFLDIGDLRIELESLVEKNAIPVVPLSLRAALGF
jgi:bifunctional aspartokinase / homoserine dehydrogenase 1